MKFAILLPTAPIHLKTFAPKSSTELHELCPPFAHCNRESEACDAVRKLQRGAVAMPFPVQIGSGKTVLLGLIAEDTQRRVIDLDKPIHFAVIVQPLPENDFERRQVTHNPKEVFVEKLWRVKPECPDIGTSHSVELRAGQLSVPLFTNASVGRDSTGRLTVHLSLGEDEISLHFDNKELQLLDVVDEVGGYDDTDVLK